MFGLAQIASAGDVLACPLVRPADIVWTGPEHRELLVQILHQARSRFVMHSTFVRDGAFAELEDEFSCAAKRGVAIDIFWGQDADDRSREQNLESRDRHQPPDFRHRRHERTSASPHVLKPWGRALRGSSARRC